MTNPINLASSMLATVAALPRGLMSRPAAEQPAALLELYEMENCPYCRVVREVLTTLDLDAMIYPCPKGGMRFRPKVIELGGKAQFPFLVDPNTGTQMYESADIVRYLYDTYADRRSLPSFVVKTVNATGASVASAVRFGAGMQARESQLPGLALQLWSFESSPYARLVRERLCELELPYQLHNIGKAKVSDFILPGIRRRLLPNYEHKGRNRVALFERTGAVQAPYLYDPNTDVGLFESADILDYLTSHYAV
ncbi:MAG: glutathione S-transferase N-terminal domain-containing protein [Pseudomonadota bacterium]